MATIVFESDKRVREVLISMLTTAGQKKILATGHAGQFQHWLREEDANTRLVIIGSHPGEDVQLLLIKMVENQPGLGGVPLLYLSEAKFSFTRPRIKRSSQASRIDAFLTRPFGLAGLKKAVVRAHEARAASRDVILYFGDRPNGALLQDLYEFEMQFHWQEVIWVRTVEEFVDKTTTLGWRVGSVFVSPTGHSDQLASHLLSLRNTRFGAQTTFAMLSQTPEDIVRYRNICDLFLPVFNGAGASTSAHGWLDILKITSGRLLNNWAARELQNQVRGHIRSHEFSAAAVLVGEGLRLDPYRYELLELAGAIQEKKGNVFQATALYKKSLTINPCSPYSYLRLLELIKGEEKSSILARSARFCPRHPQVQNRISNARSLELAQ